VRHDIQARFRVSRVPAEWGIAGYSSGGYCAANLALRHRAAFGAAAIMDGYFRPQDGPAAAALGYQPAAEAANDPIGLAQALPTGAAPLAAFWVAAGTANAADWSGAQAFVRALHGVEQVPLYREPGAGHNFYAWRPALPHALTWLWQRLAPPAMRVAFPVAGGVRESVLPAHLPPHPPARARLQGLRRVREPRARAVGYRGSRRPCRASAGSPRRCAPGTRGLPATR